MAKQQTAASVLRAISDEKSYELFKIVAAGTIDSSTLKGKSQLTRKQYYSRLSRMAKSGLVKKKKGKYFLTAFGKVVYDSQKTIENALNNYWKLKAIDSLKMSNELPTEEHNRLIETLIEDQELKNILVK